MVDLNVGGDWWLFGSGIFLGGESMEGNMGALNSRSALLELSWMLSYTWDYLRSQPI